MLRSCIIKKLTKVGRNFWTKRVKGIAKSLSSSNILEQQFFITCKRIRIESNNCFYGCFYLGPFEPGQSLTIANALRRTLLSDLNGIAITSVEIEGAFHEYTTLPGIQDSVLDILLNLKEIILKKQIFSNLIQINKTQVAYLRAKGPGIVKAIDVKLPPILECVNPEQYIATLSDSANLNIKFFINEGQNYHIQIPSKKLTPKSSHKATSNRLLMDAVFMPVLKVNYIIESNEQANDFFKLNKTMDPILLVENLDSNLIKSVAKKQKSNRKTFSIKRSFAIPVPSIFSEVKSKEEITRIPSLKLRALNFQKHQVLANFYQTKKYKNQIPTKNFLRLTYYLKGAARKKNIYRTAFAILGKKGRFSSYGLTNDKRLIFQLGRLPRTFQKIKGLFFKKKISIPLVNTLALAQSGCGFQPERQNLTTNQNPAKKSLFQEEVGNQGSSRHALKGQSVLLGRPLVSPDRQAEKPKETREREGLGQPIRLKGGERSTNLLNFKIFGTWSKKKNAKLSKLYSSDWLDQEKRKVLENVNKKKNLFTITNTNTSQAKIDLKHNILLEIWTNGSLHPREALYQSIKNLLSIFSKLKQIQFLGNLYRSEKNYKKFLDLFVYKWKNRTIVS